MSFEPIVVDMEIEEIPEVVDMELAEEINVTIIQGTDVSDTTAVESDVASGKVFHKANGDQAVGTLVEFSPAEWKDVNFCDYDGTCLYSYTASEFADLSALPDNPSHEGLVAQGWNWNLADAKAYVSAYGKHVIGQTYKTADGKTRIYVYLSQGRLSPHVGLAVNGTATIEWGDGTTSTVTGSSTGTEIQTQHTYSSDGAYIIAISVSGSIKFGGGWDAGTHILWNNDTVNNASNRCYQTSVRKVEIGDNCTFGTYAFRYCCALEAVIIPAGTTDTVSYMFTYCYALKSIVFPIGISAIETMALDYCYSIATISLPKSVNSIQSTAFGYCYVLNSICLSALTTIIGSLFYYCSSLASVIIPSSVTSIQASAFAYCSSLASVIIPSNVTSIGAYAFSNCYSLGEIHFKSSTPPAIGNSNAFNNLPTDCKIYVPTGKLSAYTGATNYPDSSTYTYVEE